MNKTELKANWEKVVDLLRGSVNDVVISTFFRPLSPLKLNEKEQKIYLLAPKESNYGIYQNRVNNYRTVLLDCIKEVFGKPYDVEVTETETAEEEDIYYAEDSLNPKYTFESFVEGPNNRLAHAASVSVAEGYSRQYNPLFLYGGSGLGKTHLMHAIGHYISQKRTRKKYIYVSAETFTAELVEAIRTKTQHAFKDKYRKVDYLLFDDVQFIAENKAVQDELFNTFEALYNANKQLVFTSDRMPNELNGIPERLISRFNQGLSVDIQPPEYETRFAILKNKALLEGLDINDPNLNAVMDVIAKGVESNIRELEGSFTRVLAHSALTGEKIDLQLAKKVLTDVIKSPKNSEIDPSNIKKAVANYYKIKVSEMESAKRSRNIAYPRQIAIYIIRELCPNYSFPKIGEIFGGRDHTTILHSYEKICDEIRTSPDLKDIISNIEATLNA